MIEEIIWRGRMSANSYESVKEYRTDEITTIKKAVENGTSVSIVGPSESGKSSLMEYCKEKVIRGAAYLDLQRVISEEDFRLSLEDRGIVFKELSSQKPAVIFLDEIGKLAFFTEEDKSLVVKTILEMAKTNKVAWVLSSIEGLSKIDNRLAGLNVTEVKLNKIPLELRPER